MAKCSNLRGPRKKFWSLIPEIQEEVFTSPAVLLEQICKGGKVILERVRRWLVFGRGTHGDEIPVLPQELPSFPAPQAGRAVQGKLLAEGQWEEGLN